MISVTSLDAGYGGRAVLSSVSFSVKSGELVGLIGPNGAGKSTLLKTMRGMLPPLSGSITVMGHDTQQMDARTFARAAAYLEQRMDTPFGYTAGEVVLAGRYPYLSWWQRESERDREVAEACMTYTGVLPLAAVPLGHMSGGQMQRVLLAKVLAQQTPILFLDEPATGLDILYQEEIFRFCRELSSAGKTILVVVHELSLAARFCTRLLLLAKGRLMADGEPREVLSDALLSEAYGTLMRVVENPRTGHSEVFTEAVPRTAEQEKMLQIILGMGR